MELNFKLVEKTYKSENGTEIKYYVLQKALIDNTLLEIPVKGDKSKLLLMSLTVENKINKKGE